MLAFLVSLLTFPLRLVAAVMRFPWVRWCALDRRARSPRVFTVRTANAWQAFIGPVVLMLPMPYSRVFLDGTARSAPWLLPKQSGIRAALGLTALLALTPVPVSAQVIAGSQLYFDHTAEEQAAVERYQLCVSTDCRDMGVLRVGTSDTLSFTVPSWVPRGRQDFTVRAVWKAPLTGTSAPTNVLSQTVVGGPERLRSTATATP